MGNKYKNFRGKQIPSGGVLASDESDEYVLIEVDPEIIPESRECGVRERVPKSIFKPQRPDPDLDPRFLE